MPTTITVQQLLDTKGDAVHSVSPHATVLEAIKILAEAKIGALPVIDEGKLVGIFSERDYAHKIILEGRYSKDTHVKEVMTTKVCTVTLEQTVQECMILMNKNRFRHLPVIENGKVVGVVSIGDFVRAILMSLV